MAGFKKTLLNLAVFTTSLLIALLIGEGMVRLFLPQDALLVRAYQKSDPDLGIVSQSNIQYQDNKSMPHFSYLVNTNNLGLRMEADADKIRPSILYMGDSFTFGWGVDIEDSYYSLLSNATTPDSTFQSLNCGHGSYSTGHVSTRLKRLSEHVNVSKVIYFMNFNDLFDNINTDINYRTHSYSENDLGQYILKKELVYSGFKRFLLRCTPYSWLNGGQIIAKGTPEDVAKSKASFTGKYLAPLLKRK